MSIEAIIFYILLIDAIGANVVVRLESVSKFKHLSRFAERAA